MAVQIKNNSPLRFGTFVSVDDAEFWDVVDLPSIPEQADDLRYTVTAVDRIDSLAHRFYRDARLWWVIAVANDMELVPTAFNVGQEIRIPSPRFITQSLFNRVSRKTA